MIISDLKNILTGWKNVLMKKSLSKDQMMVAELRLQSCSNCEYTDESWIGKVIDLLTGKRSKKKEDQELVTKCRLCQCPNAPKSMAWADQCPLPHYKGTTYPHLKRWGSVQFDDHGTLIGETNVYITLPTSSPEAASPVSH